jgi:hypothetical protein
VGDHHERPDVLGQVAGQPVDGVQVEMVGRLVEQQQVVGAAQQRGQRHPAALAPGHPLRRGLQVDPGQQRGEHRAAAHIRRPLVLGERAEDQLPHRPRQLLRLRQVAEGQVAHSRRAAGI